MINIGIECESIENDSYGVARLIRKLLEQLAARHNLMQTHRFILYFNGRIPDEPSLNNRIFEKRLIGLPRWGLPSSFSVYYYILLPISLWFGPPAVMYYPNYMLPIIHPPFVPSLVMLTEDIWHQIHNPRLAMRYRIAYWMFGTWAARFAVRIVALSRSSRSAMANLFHIAPARVRVNMPGVDAPVDVQAMPGDYFLFVGQAFERRHLREAIAAFEPLAAQNSKLQLVAIGPDRYKPLLIQNLVSAVNRRLGRLAIRHIDRVTDDDLARWYRGAISVVYISEVEAFGLPPLEALSYGTPAIVADRPVNREVYGELAFFVTDPANISDIERAMRTAITATRRRRKIIKAGPTVAAQYTWNSHANRFLATTNEILHT